MKKKTIACIAYVVLAFGVCVVPTVAMPFVDTEQTSENRTLKKMPSFKKEDGTWNQDWGTEFESYFSDHFAFRQDMADVYDTVLGATLKTSAQADVIIGKDDWLYYTPTVQDYVNEAKITEVGAKHIGHVLEMMQDYAEENGAKFIFTSAPNKNSIYPEYMPARYICSEQSDTLTLIEQALSNTDVCYCPLRTILSEQKTTDVSLYHKWDTHWNNYGARIAFDALMDTAGLEHMDYTDVSYTIEQNWDGDLSQMLYPTSEKKDENVIYDYEPSYSYLGRFRSTDDLSIRTHNPTAQEQSLLMFRDSFGRALIPFLAEDFSSTTFLRADHYPMDTLEQTPSDVVILELVERNLPNLLGYAPQMPAPIVTIPEEPERVKTDTDATLQIEKNGNYLHLYGSYDADYANQDRIFVTISSENGAKQTYEAFPCYEYAQMEQDAPLDNGYSLYIPTETFDASVQTVQITVLFNQHYRNLGTAGQFQLGANQ